MPTISIRFSDSPEDQKLAKEILGAMREGPSQEPIFERDGVPYYRVLMFGLSWCRVPPNFYYAADGQTGRSAVYRVEKIKVPGKLKWRAEYTADWDGAKEWTTPGKVSLFKTMAEAKTACEEHARQQKGSER